MLRNSFLQKISTVAIATTIFACTCGSFDVKAEVESRVIKDKENNLYEYNLKELSSSFVSYKLSGDQAKNAGLFKDYNNRMVNLYAFKDSINGYIDYADISKNYIKNKLAGKDFDINAFTESSQAQKTTVSNVSNVILNNGEVVIKEQQKEQVEFEILSIE